LEGCEGEEGEKRVEEKVRKFLLVTSGMRQ